VNFKQIYLKNHGNAEACLLTTLWTFAYQYSSLIGPFVKLAWIHCLCHVCFIIKNNIPSMTNKPFPFKMGAHASGHDRMVVGFKTTYICNQCNSPLMWVWISISARCTKFVSDLRQVGGFLRGSSGFLQQ